MAGRFSLLFPFRRIGFVGFGRRLGDGEGYVFAAFATQGMVINLNSFLSFYTEPMISQSPETGLLKIPFTGRGNQHCKNCKNTKLSKYPCLLSVFSEVLEDVSDDVSPAEL